MKVSFELSPRDLRFFRDRLKQVRESDAAHDESVVIRGAANMVKEAVATEPPDFVVERIQKLERLIEMLKDAEWRLEGDDRERVLDALVYFVDPDDLIHDHVPGIGYLDDAIMVELVARELTHDIEAYDDFCKYRKSGLRSEVVNRLEKRRQALQARMRRRRRRDRSASRPKAASANSRLRLW